MFIHRKILKEIEKYSIKEISSRDPEILGNKRADTQNYKL